MEVFEETKHKERQHIRETRIHDKVFSVSNFGRILIVSMLPIFQKKKNLFSSFFPATQNFRKFISLACTHAFLPPYLARDNLSRLCAIKLNASKHNTIQPNIVKHNNTHVMKRQTKAVPTGCCHVDKKACCEVPSRSEQVDQFFFCPWALHRSRNRPIAVKETPASSRSKRVCNHPYIRFRVSFNQQNALNTGVLSSYTICSFFERPVLPHEQRNA